MPNYHRQSLPPASGPDLLVRRLKAEEKLTFQIIAQAIAGFWVHWSKGENHSEPCMGPKSICPGCDKDLPKRWKGFLHVGNMHNRRQEFLELTPAPAQMLLDQVGQGEVLRGLRIQCERGKGPKARVRVTVLPPLDGCPALPVELDPTPTLEKLWKLSGVDLKIFQIDERSQYAS